MLNFGNGTQATHYFILCFVSILGAMQISAARYGRHDRLWFAARPSLFLGGIMIGASFVWFFWVDAEIFIPGLAGGEMIAIFFAAFATAVPVTRGVACCIARWVRNDSPAPQPSPIRERGLDASTLRGDHSTSPHDGAGIEVRGSIFYNPQSHSSN